MVATYRKPVSSKITETKNAGTLGTYQVCVTENSRSAIPSVTTEILASSILGQFLKTLPTLPLSLIEINCKIVHGCSVSGR